MRLKELNREQLEALVKNLFLILMGLGALLIVAALIAAVLLTKGN